MLQTIWMIIEGIFAAYGLLTIVSVIRIVSVAMKDQEVYDMIEEVYDKDIQTLIRLIH